MMHQQETLRVYYVTTTSMRGVPDSGLK